MDDAIFDLDGMVDLNEDANDLLDASEQRGQSKGQEGSSSRQPELSRKQVAGSRGVSDYLMEEEGSVEDADQMSEVDELYELAREAREEEVVFQPQAKEITEPEQVGEAHVVQE